MKLRVLYEPTGTRIRLGGNEKDDAAITSKFLRPRGR